MIGEGQEERQLLNSWATNNNISYINIMKISIDMEGRDHQCLLPWQTLYEKYDMKGQEIMITVSAIHQTLYEKYNFPG